MPRASRLGTSPGQPRSWLEGRRFHLSDDCLVWPFAINAFGYGILKAGTRTLVASRVMCAMAHGQPPTPDHEAAHSCGNPQCVNPKHIRWATAKENHADKIGHGTNGAGEKSNFAKLRAGAMLAIRESDEPSAELARRFDVTTRTVRHIRGGRTWNPEHALTLDAKSAHRAKVREINRGTRLT